MSELIGQTYEILKEIGSGGSGRVFLAKHLRLGKKVVLKAYNQKISARPELLRREVDVLKELSHTHIPRVYDFFSEDEVTYTVMDYIEGESLDRALERGEKFSQPQVIRWAKQLLDALCYLHSSMHGSPPRGYVHSDIKPANLMRTSDNEIVLIDFNIALALGEEHVIGCSSGYASPEHYGLDYSSGSGNTGNVTTGTKDRKTVLIGSRVVVPDVRSDIYSAGATLYHLLSGRRPSRDATNVVPLSKQEYSPQIVNIISKAMNPNPDLRYQTAKEMLWDFSHLRENDPRVKRQRRNRIAAGILLSALFASGAASAFIGLKRMQITENWLKLAEYSKNAMSAGNPVMAIDYALQALPQETGFLRPDYTAEAQRALASALGVYDLEDGYKTEETVILSSVPFYLAIAPDGKTAACVYSGSVAVFDTNSADILAVLPAEVSALSEVEYLDNRTILYAGDGGLKAYDIVDGIELWAGQPTTAISISGDKKSIAGIYKDDNAAVIYNAADGKVKATVDFGQKHQKVTVNDGFANPNDNLFALNNDGTMLGVSFEEGSLQIYHLFHPGEELLLFDENSGYTHFEGGFHQQYFAFSATNASESVFAVIDTEKQEQTGGYESENAFSVQADESGIYVQTGNILVNIHPVTGEQKPLVTTAENIRRFARSDKHTLITSKEEYLFFDRSANLISREKKEGDSELFEIAAGNAVMGSRDTPIVRIMKYESYPDREVFSYDSGYIHDEARISADESTIMLFSYDRFCIFGRDGKQRKEVLIPDAEQVYDQQYRREGEKSWLEVIYNDGTVSAYSAEDGNLLWEQIRERPDLSLYEEFLTDKLRIESPLHEKPTVYDRKTGRLLCRLEEDAYLTYVTQARENIVVQYMTADGYCYGQLLNEKCEILADLPYLCDIVGERLFFDYPTGNIRETRIYNINELIETAQDKTTGGK